MDKYEAAEQILVMRDEIMELIWKARCLAGEFISDNDMHGFDAYVFEPLKEHLNKSNRYNQDFENVAQAIENSNTDDED